MLILMLLYHYNFSNLWGSKKSRLPSVDILKYFPSFPSFFSNPLFSSGQWPWSLFQLSWGEKKSMDWTGHRQTTIHAEIHTESQLRTLKYMPLDCACMDRENMQILHRLKCILCIYSNYYYYLKLWYFVLNNNT